MKSFNTNSINNDEWLTPPEIIHALGPFDLDPCAPVDRPWDMAGAHFTTIQDGLACKWFGRVWCNPPYGRETFKWLNKLAGHKSGIALIFARTETSGFHTEIWNKAHAVFFFQGRLRFFYVTGKRGDTANAPSCLVSYSDIDTKIIQRAHAQGLIKGKLVLVNHDEAHSFYSRRPAECFGADE